MVTKPVSGVRNGNRFRVTGGAALEKFQLVAVQIETLLQMVEHFKQSFDANIRAVGYNDLRLTHNTFSTTPLTVTVF